MVAGSVSATAVASGAQVLFSLTTAEYQDVKAGGLFLQSQSLVNAERVGVYGLSYGGLNCLQALARDSSLFKVGVANAPVFNWLSEGYEIN